MKIKDRQEKFLFYENDIPFISNTTYSDGLCDYIPNDLFVHWHEDVEILYYKKGGGYVYVDGEIIEPQAGDVIIVNPMEIHSILWGDNLFEYTYSIVSPKMFASSDVDIFSKIWDAWVKKEHLFTHCIRGDDEVRDLIESIIKEKEEKNVGYEMMIKGKLHILLGILMRRYEVAESKKANSSQVYRSERIKDVFRFVEDNYSAPISSKTLADKYGVCEEHFCRLFRKITQMSPKEYITKYRIMKAEQLLISTNIGMTEISEKVGFVDANYFSRVFKKINGLSPMKFRKRNNNDLQKFSIYEK